MGDRIVAGRADSYFITSSSQWEKPIDLCRVGVVYQIDSIASQPNEGPSFDTTAYNRYKLN